MPAILEETPLTWQEIEQIANPHQGIYPTISTPDPLEIKARGLMAMHELSAELSSEESICDQFFGTTVGRRVRNTALTSLEEERNRSQTVIARRDLSLAEEEFEFEKKKAAYREQQENKKRIAVSEIKEEVIRLNREESYKNCPFDGPEKIIKVTCSAYQQEHGFEARINHQCELAGAIDSKVYSEERREKILQRQGCPTTLDHNGPHYSASFRSFDCKFAMGKEIEIKKYSTALYSSGNREESTPSIICSFLRGIGILE